MATYGRRHFQLRFFEFRRTADDESALLGPMEQSMIRLGSQTEIFTGPRASVTLQWRHNEHDGISNDQPQHCLLRVQIKENIKAPRHWPLCRRPVNSPHKWPVTWKMLPFDDVIMS